MDPICINALFCIFLHSVKRTIKRVVGRFDFESQRYLPIHVQKQDWRAEFLVLCGLGMGFGERWEIFKGRKGL